MKLPKYIPYILIFASLVLLIYDASLKEFVLNNDYWKSNISSILIMIVGIGLLYIGKKQR